MMAIGHALPRAAAMRALGLKARRAHVMAGPLARVSHVGHDALGFGNVSQMLQSVC